MNLPCGHTERNPCCKVCFLVSLREENYDLFLRQALAMPFVPPADCMMPKEVKPAMRRFDCLFLGPPTGQTKDCPSCKGTVRLKVFRCSHPEHGTVTSKDCAVCPDYRRPA